MSESGSDGGRRARRPIDEQIDAAGTLDRRRLLRLGGAAFAAAAGATVFGCSVGDDDRTAPEGTAPNTGPPAAPSSAGAFTTPPPTTTSTPGSLPTRKMGRIEWDATLVSLGGAYLDGPETVIRALDAGMNVIDTAPSGVYGRSHEILAEVVPGRRDEVLLMSKVDSRTRDGANANLRDSLERMQVEHIDVLMLHGLGYADEVDQVFAPGGSMEAVLEAQSAGVVRYVGFSCHRSTQIAVQALERFDFDMVMAPVSPVDYLMDDFTAALLPYAQQRNIALVGMKFLASGALPDPELALQWAMSQPWHTISAGVSSIAQVDTNVRVAREFTPLSAQRQADVVNQWSSYADPSRYYWRQNLARIA